MTDPKARVVEIASQITGIGDARLLADRLGQAGVLAPEWVSVEERLPEPMTEVLVEVNGHRGPSWRNNHNLVAYVTYGGAWLEERHGLNPLDVTHWLPLPKPPQGD